MALSLDYYLHYHWENIPKSVIESKIWEETKEEILTKHLESLARRKEAAIQKAKEIGEEERRLVQDLLSPAGEESHLLKDIGKISPSDYVSSTKNDLDFNIHEQKLLEILSSDIEDLNNIEDFVKKLNDYLSTLPKLTQDLLDLYTYDIVERARQKSGKGNILHSKNLSKYGEDIETKIIAALMGRYSMDAFVIPENSSINFVTAMGKIKLMAELLPLIDFDKGIDTRHEKEKIREDLTGSELKQEILNKCKAWLENADKTAKEITHAKGIFEIKINQILPAFKLLEDTVVEVESSPTKNYEVKFTGDDDIAEMRKTLGLSLEKDIKRSKKDCSFKITKDGTEITVSLGTNVKNYQNPISENLSSYRIEIQNGTPLFYFLTREAGYTGYQMWEILQVATAFDKDRSFAEANKKWNSLMEKIQYRSLLNALAGFENTNDQSFYMCINKNFWTMEDFIIHFLRDSNSAMALAERKNLENKETGKREFYYGLIRSTYSDVNKFRPENDRSERRLKAIERSNDTWDKSLEIMYNTKVRVEITIKEIARLFKKVL